MPVVGSAEIIVTAITAGFRQQIKQAFRDARPEAAKEGERYGKAFGDKFRIQLKNDMRKSFRENRDWIKQEGARQGKAFGTEFAKSFSTEFQARLPRAFENALGDPSKTGENYGKTFADAMKRGAQRGGTVAASDLISPDVAKQQSAGAGAQAPDRRPGPALDTGRTSVKAAEKSYAELQALLREHEGTLHDITQKAADDAVALERAKLTRIETERERSVAADDDQLSAHLAQVLKVAEIEEGVAERLAKLSADRQAEAQANLDTTTAKIKAAARALSSAKIAGGGKQAGRKELEDAQKRYNELRALSERSALEDERSKRERVISTDAYLVALEKVKDRELDLEKARQQKKSIAAAQAAIADARVAADSARKAAAAQMRWSDTASKRRIADAEETAAALQRLDEAHQLAGARLNPFTIRAAEQEYERLKQLRDQAVTDRDAAEQQEFEDHERWTEAEYNVTQRVEDLKTAKGRQAAKIRQEIKQAEIEAAQALARAQKSAGAADVSRVHHESIIVDVKVLKDRIDLYKEGRRSALSFFRGFSPEFENKAKEARKKFQSLSAMGMLIGPALATGIGAIASLGSGLVSLAAAAAQAAGTLVVIPGLIGALGQAAITAVIAFKGIGQALSAGFKSSEAAVGDTGKATLSQARAIADARKALSRAYEDSARRMRDANRDVANAEQDLAESQNLAKIAQNALTGARKRAIENLEDLQFSLEGAVLSEEEAVLRLQRATQALAEVRANPASTAQELMEASLNYREAELALRMAQDALEDVQEEQAAAAAAGVEGSQEVVDAQNDIIDANNRVADNLEKLRLAEEGRADDAIQNARAIADAQERLTEALENVGGAAGGAKAAAEAYEAELAKLSPAARGFVEYIVSIKDKFKTLKAAAGEELFGPLQAGLENVVTNFFPALEDALRKTGGALGSFATSITDVLASSDFIERFTIIAEDNTTTIERFGDIIAAVIDGISGVLVAAGPLIDRFTSFLSDKAKDFQNFATSGEGIADMAVFFQEAGDTAAKFGEIIGNLGGAFGGLLSAANDSGQTMLDRLIEISENFEDFTTSISGHQELTQFFDEAGANASEVTGLIWDIIKALGSLGNAPGVGEAAKKLRAQWVPTLERIGESMADAGSALADFVINVTDLIEAFADSGSIKVFLGLLAGIAGVLAVLVNSDIGSFIIGVVGPMVALGHAVGIAASVFGFFGKAIVGSYLALERLALALAIALPALAGIVVEALAATGAFVAGMFSLEGFSAAMILAGGAVKTLGAAMLTLLTNPVFIAIAAVAALAAAFFHFKAEAKEAAERNQAFADSLDEVTKSATTKTFDVFAENLDDKVTTSLKRAGVSVEEFFAAVAGGTDEYNAFYDSIKNSSAAEEDQTAILGALQSQNEAWASTVDNAKNSVTGHSDALGVAADKAGIYNDAAYKAVGILKDEEYAAGLAKDAVNKLNSEYDELIDNFTILEEGALSEERTQIRLNDVLSNSKDILKEFSFSLKDGTKAGDEYKSYLLDGVEAIEAFAQAQLDHGVAAGEVQKALDGNITALVKSVGSSKSAQDAARNYINEVIQTPTDIATTFTAIGDQQSVKSVMDMLDPLTQAQLAIIKPEMDFKSAEDVNRAVAALALATGAQHPIKLKPEVVTASINTVEKDLADLLTDENGNIRTVNMLTAAEKKTYIATARQLDILMNNPDNNRPREAIYLTEAEQKQYDHLLDQLQELTVDENGNPRKAEYMTEEQKAQYKTTQDNLRALMYNSDGTVRKVPYNSQADTSGAKNTIDAFTREKRDANINARVVFNPYQANILKYLQTFPKSTDSQLNELLRLGKIQKLPDGTYLIMAEGGPVTGPGGPKDDKVGPYMLSSGEFVLSAKAVQSLGGTSTVNALHKALKSGIRPPHLASGGVMPARSGGTLSLLAEAGKAERVEPLDVNGLSAGDRAILAELRRLRSGDNGKFLVNIGTIEVPTPPAAAKEVVSALRAEAYQMGMFS